MGKKTVLIKVTFLPLVSHLIALATAADDQASLEEIITSQSRHEKPLSDLSGNITAVSASELDLVKPTHFNELAVRLSGVNLSRNSGQEYLAAIRSPIFTGSGACGAFLMAQDNIPLRAAGFCNANELFEGFTEQAERVEVVKGPGSALYGSNALHGMINIITAKAGTDEGKASVETGADDFIRLNFSKGFSGEKQGLRLSASLTHDGGFRDQSGYDQQKINLRHHYQGDAWEIESSLYLTNLDQETAGYITGRDAYQDAAKIRTNPNPEAFRKARSLRYWTQFSTALTENAQWRITPYMRLLEMEFLMHFLPGQPLEENSQASFGLQNGFYLYPGHDIELVTGFDLEYTRGALKQTQAAPTTGSAFLQATVPAGKQYDYDVDSFMAAAFLQGDMALGEKLSLLAGARLEYIRYDYRNNMLSGRTRDDGTACGFGGCRYSRPEDRRDDFTVFSPKVGLLYKYHQNHHLYLNLSHGFRAPQATELYRLQREQQVADLDKVSLKNAEIGLRGEGTRWRYDIAFYVMDKTNYIFRDSSYFNVNNGESDHIGADLTLGFDVTQQVSLSGNVSFARHRYNFDYVSNGINLKGREIDTAPNEFGSLQVTWRPAKNITMEMEWVHMGRYFLDPENLYQYGGHDYFNMRGFVDISDHIRFSFRLMNLTNRKYAERADYTVFSGPRYFPARPRSLYLGVSATF